MSERIVKTQETNSAIVKKVESILNNTEHIRDMKIEITGSIGVAPSIKYEISEFIIPKSENETR